MLFIDIIYRPVAYIVELRLRQDNVSYGSSLGASDHISFTVELLCNLKNVERKTVKRNYNKGDYSGARDYLSSVNWSEMNSMNVQESWDFFIGHVTDCVNTYIPIKGSSKIKKITVD